MKRFLEPGVIVLACVTAAACGTTAPQFAEPAGGPLTAAQVLERAAAEDWRVPDAENTLYLELESGRVIIELAPDFAPLHASNIRTLVRERYFDGIPIIRVQENYVVQWGDPGGQKSLGGARPEVAAEFSRPIADDLPFTPLPDGDVYAPHAGFTRGFAAGRDSDHTWLAHCYGMVGAGRGMEPESSGAELYVVIGHAPRHLDRNITLVGRVIHGMEHLTTLPRGTGALGFYEDPNQYVTIRSARLAADLPGNKRENLEILRTDTDTFRRLIEARRFRREDWFLDPVGRVELCNVPVPVRRRPDHPTR